MQGRTIHTPGASRVNGPAEDEGLLRVLDEAQASVESGGFPYLMIGGVASAVWGRGRWPQDLDFFVRAEDAPAVLSALEGAGFEVSVESQHWLFKAFKEGTTVDIIFRSVRDILLDDEMLGRGIEMDFRGRQVPLAPPEDVLVMKAVATAEDTPRYWHDALAIIANSELDWDYLIRRARQHGVRRVLSLLLYAQSNDLVVPMEPIGALFDSIVRGSQVDL